MPRKATGQVIERNGKRGRNYALRFRAYGKRQFLTLGRADDGWTRQKAEVELENVLADVRRGIWQPPDPEPAAEEPHREEPTFHEFASEWYAAREHELADRTRVDYQWRLSSHLLPYFAKRRVSGLTVEDVDRYRAYKVAERGRVARARERGETTARPLSNESINKTIVLLASVLESAVEYGYLPANPARGKRRRLKVSPPARSFLNPEQVETLLRAAKELDAEARPGDTGRRLPLVATLALAGLRIGETLNLRWRDVNLAGGTLNVADSKTAAGIRRVDLTPAMREFLADFRARTRHGAAPDLVFATSKGHRESESNVRRRIVEPAVERADAQLLAEGRQPMPSGVTPHSLRRTYISILLAAGADVRYVMGQVGHTDPGLTLRIYAQVIDSDRGHGGEVDRLVGASNWAQTGTNAVLSDANGVGTVTAENEKDPR